MVRVYGDGASLLVDREHEVEVTRLMCSYKLAAQIYCSFENGSCLFIFFFSHNIHNINFIF